MKKFWMAIFALVSMSFGYSYTAFSLLTPEKSIAVNPYIYGDGAGFVGTDVFLSYGMTAKSDIWMQVTATNIGTVDFSTMLRYSLSQSSIIGLRASGNWVAPQYHFIWENDRIALQSNVVGQFNYQYMNKPAVFGIFSPVLKIWNGIDVFAEVNPGYYMQDGDFANLWVRPEGFGLDIVGGVGFKIGECLFSIACPVYDVTNDPTPTFGFWFCFMK